MLIVGVADDVVVPVRFVIRLLDSVLVLEIDGTTTPSTARTPAADRDSVVSDAAPSSTDPTPRAVLVEAVIPLTGNAVPFVRFTDDGVPRAGVTSVGEVAFT